MANRFRVEIYDANKANDITIYSEQGVDKEYLTELVFSNIRNFSGKINAYVFDNVKKKKTTAMFLDESTVEFNKNKIKIRYYTHACNDQWPVYLPFQGLFTLSQLFNCKKVLLFILNGSLLSSK